MFCGNQTLVVLLWVSGSRYGSPTDCTFGDLIKGNRNTCYTVLPHLDVQVHQQTCYSLQSDGNLVLYDADRKALWASDSNGEFGKAELVVQDDMNVVLYKTEGRKALWATDTSGAECAVAPSVVGT